MLRLSTPQFVNQTQVQTQNCFCALLPYSWRFVGVLQGCGIQTDAPHRLRAIVATTSLCHCQGRQGIWGDLESG